MYKDFDKKLYVHPDYKNIYYSFYVKQ